LNDHHFPFAQQMSISEALHKAYAHWAAGQAPQAEALCMRVLQVLPAQADAWHLLGLMAHAYGKLDLAVDFMRKACQAPDASAQYCSNLAEMCRQKGALAEAELAARRAVKADPHYIAAWNNLGIILQESGQFQEALACLQRVAAAQQDNAEVHNNLGNTYKRLGELDAALASYQRALALHPQYAQAYSNLAFLLNDLRRVDEAVAAAQRAIEIDPQLGDAYFNLAQIEMSRLQHAKARQWINALLAFAPHHAGALTARAQLLTAEGLAQEAVDSARQAVSLQPDSANAHLVLGRALQALGQSAQALAAFDQAAALPGTVAEEAMLLKATTLQEAGDKEGAQRAFDEALRRFPGSLRVIASRADSRTFVEGDEDIKAMQAALAQPGKWAPDERMSLHFALGKALLDTGDAGSAFEHLHQGNALKRATFDYDPKRSRAWFEQIAEVFTGALMEQFKSHEPATQRPVFIVGMPRSGTTLVEQILASHPAVHGAGELFALHQAVSAAGEFPQSVRSWQAADLERIGRDYLARTQDLAPQARRLVDKMPSNFAYAGLIALILPGARIIHCRRDPIDTCLSCYTKLFSGDQPFAYQLDELADFHLAYQELMASLRQVLPADRFLEVDYEEVVADLETQARRMVAFIDLEWDEACLHFHQTQRVVRTASVSQVRKPIYRSSTGRWRRYAKHLGPLVAALGGEAAEADA